MAWLQDDYGAGDDSVKFYNNNIPLDQRKVHEKTRSLVNERIGSYKDVKAETQNPGSNPKLTGQLAHWRIPEYPFSGSRAMTTRKRNVHS